MADILIVDDHVEARQLFGMILANAGHIIAEAGDGAEALERARAAPPDLIVTDVLMPRMDGFQFCRELGQDARLRRLPIIFCSATYLSPEDMKLATDLGVRRFLVKPIEARTLRDAVGDVLADGPEREPTARLRRLDDSQFNMRHAAAVSDKVLEKVRELEAAKLRLDDQQRELERYVAELEVMLDGTVSTITKLGELRDPYTAGHEQRVGKLAAAIGAELGYDPHRVRGLDIIGRLHDVGKVSVPAETLVKPTRLTPIEFELVKQHAQQGYEILRHATFPWPVAEAARQHHERLDGSGYPRGLVGEAILPEARIIAVADTVEAMSSHRPYRPALGLEPALEEIERGAGRLFDSSVVAACLRLFRSRNFTFGAAGAERSGICS